MIELCATRDRGDDGAVSRGASDDLMELTVGVLTLESPQAGHRSTSASLTT